MNAKTLLVLASFTATSIASASTASTWYVDDDNYGKSGLDGSTEATAFGTIQDAMNNSQLKAGDTILVLPGTYDQGYATYTPDKSEYDGVLTNRVLFTKDNLTLKSRDGATATHIVGAYAVPGYYSPTEIRSGYVAATTNAWNCGVGPSAVRCIQAPKAGCRIEGFTIRDGAAHILNNGTDGIANQGGGVRGAGVSETFVVDCVISNCIGTRGGALRGATAVRCRIIGNKTSSGTAVARNAELINCFIARNLSPYNPKANHVFATTLRNCTIVENPDTPFCGQSCKLYNTIIVNNGQEPHNGGESCEVYGSVFETATFGKGYVEDCAAGVSPVQFFAPLFGDWRLLPTSDAVGRGDAINVNSSVLAGTGIDPYVDLDGKAISKTGTIHAGCFQSVGPTPVAGAYFDTSCPISVSNALTGATYANLANNAAYAFTTSTAAGQLFKIFPQPLAGTALYRFVHPDRKRFANLVEWPLMDEALWCVFPPTGVLTTQVICASNQLYVDPENGLDTNTGTSPSSPVLSIQQAISNAPSGSATVIHCPAGTYDKGGMVNRGILTRVLIDSSEKYLRIKGAGAGKSFIVGGMDPDHLEGAAGGRGPKSVRCVEICASSAYRCVQGFTLCDGSTLEGDTNNDMYNGGGLLAFSETSCLYDCAITNCTGVRGGAAKYGTLVRCRIHDCPAHTGGMTRDTLMYSCVIDNNLHHPAQPSECGPIYGNGCKGRQNTCIGNASSYAYDAYAVPSTNCVFAQNGGTLTRALQPGAGGLFFGDGIEVTSAVDATRDYTNVTTGVFSDLAHGDYRLLSASDAVTRGRAEDYWLYPLADVNGNPLRFVDGAPMIGAIHDAPIPSVRIELTAQSGTLTPSPANGITRIPAEGLPLMSVLTGSTRPFLGYRITGDVNCIVTNTTLDLTLPYASGAGIGRYVITPVYTSDWYVSPTGDDTANGFSPLTPVKTLQQAMALPLLSGDTVHALPGTYAEGSMPVDSYYTSNYQGAKGEGYTTPVRVSVKPNITLVADEGPEKTIIKGEFTSTEDGGNMNRGANSMRCAQVCATATLRGFTLTGGSTRTESLVTGENELHSGGGVIAKHGDYTARIVDCVISNNYAARGGGGIGGLYLGCRIVGNYSSGNPIAIGRAHAKGCYIDDNWGSAETIRYPQMLLNCTIGAGNAKTQGGTPNTIMIQDAGGIRIYNCLVMGGAYPEGTDSSKKPFIGSNSVFYVRGGGTLGLTKSGNCITNVSLEEINLLAGGKLGKGSVAIDAGLNDWRTDYGELTNDCFGTQRIYNGTIDIGCAEYDWRADYAAAIGSGVTVSHATEGVRLADGKVTLADGEAIAGQLAKKSATATVTHALTVTPTDGTVTGVFADQAVSATARADLAARTRGYDGLDFAFAFDGAGGSATVTDYAATVRGLIFLIK